MDISVISIVCVCVGGFVCGYGIQKDKTSLILVGALVAVIGFLVQEYQYPNPPVESHSILNDTTFLYETKIMEVEIIDHETFLIIDDE